MTSAPQNEGERKHMNFSKTRHFFFLFNKLPYETCYHLMRAIDLLDMAIYIDISRGMTLHSILI